MSKKSKHFILALTRKELDALGLVLDNYVLDCSVNTKTLAAVERVVSKIIRCKIGRLFDE